MTITHASLVSTAKAFYDKTPTPHALFVLNDAHQVLRLTWYSDEGTHLHDVSVRPEGLHVYNHLSIPQGEGHIRSHRNPKVETHKLTDSEVLSLLT